MDAGTASLTLLTGTSAWEKTECSDMDFKQTIAEVQSTSTEARSTSQKIVVYIEEIFDILSKLHLENKHCKTGKLHKLANEKYYNISRECVTIFLSFCDCPATKKGVDPAPKPQINVKKLNGRAWVMFVEQPLHDGLRYIMMYTEWSTKFCQIRAIKDLSPLTIVIALIEVLTGFGSPYVLHFEIEKDLQEQVLNELSNHLKAKIVLGEDRQDIFDDMLKEKDVLLKKLEQYVTLSWTISIKFIQFELNKGEIQPNVTPYESLFGVKMNQNGRTSATLSMDLIDQIFNGEYAENSGDDD